MADKAYKYRIYPSEGQRVLFEKTFGCCRKVWNLMLADKRAYYKKEHKILQTTPAQYKDSYPFLREVDSLALANVQLHLQSSFKSCYKDHNTEPPKFKSKHHSRKSYTTNNQGGTVAVMDGGIRLPKTGIVKAVIHRKADHSWKLKSATVSRDSAGDYFCSVLYEYEPGMSAVPAMEGANAIGLDYKSDGLYMDSEGRCANMPKPFRESQKKLARAQRRLSRRKGSRKGEAKSKNWIKAQKRVNRIYRHAANQRKDFLHKTSAAIAKRYGAVCIESLDMKAMSNKGFGNGKATMDNGYGAFVRMLEYKLSDRGKHLVRVGRWYPSSQLCHICGHRQKMPLSKRTYICPGCGMVLDRDVNAAINIKNEGLRILHAA